MCARPQPILERCASRFRIVKHAEEMVLGLNVRQEEVSWQVDLLRERRHELQMGLCGIV